MSSFVKFMLGKREGGIILLSNLQMNDVSHFTGLRSSNLL